VHQSKKIAISRIWDKNGRRLIEKREITLTVNGRRHLVRVDPRRTLVDAIRDDCGDAAAAKLGARR